MAEPQTATLSDLLRHPNEVIARLDAGAITITRRDGEALVLAKAGAARGGQRVLDQLSQLIASSLDDATCDRMADSLTDQHPWVVLLPDPARRTFVGDYFRLLRASAATGGFAQLRPFLDSWEATAEAYAHGVTPPTVDLEYAHSTAAVAPAP